MAHSYVSNNLHCVFGTKNRQKFIAPDLQGRLWAYMGGIAKQNQMATLAVGGTDDHAHLLMSLPSTVPVAKAVQLIKGGSSKWMNDTFAPEQRFEWQEGYASFSVSVSLLKKTVRYISEQLEHHKTQTFEQEFLAFLERHGVDYDPRYVFG